MSRRGAPLFLARQTYRARRIREGARVLPVLGVVLVLLPLLWAGDPETPAPTRGGMIYIFGVWLLLIAAAGWLSRRLDTSAAEEPDEGP